MAKYAYVHAKSVRCHQGLVHILYAWAAGTYVDAVDRARAIPMEGHPELGTHKRQEVPLTTAITCFRCMVGWQNLSTWNARNT
jgi:hypothetical protein